MLHNVEMPESNVRNREGGSQGACWVCLCKHSGAQSSLAGLLVFMVPGEVEPSDTLPFSFSFPTVQVSFLPPGLWIYAQWWDYEIVRWFIFKFYGKLGIVFRKRGMYL